MDFMNFTAPCGIDCFNCQLFEGNADTSERLMLNSLRPELSNIQCKGCRQQNCPLLPHACQTRQCAKNHSVNFCYECTEFPCRLLAPVADEAQKFPHNMKVFNLCRMKAVGVERWAAEEARAIRDRYFTGKFEIGAGPKKS